MSTEGRRPASGLQPQPGSGLLALYGIIGYAGLRTAKNAKGDYAKLLAAGLTSLILCQALLNVYAVLGIAPLTGVPLPFISSGSTSLVVLLCSMGLLLNIAAGGYTKQVSMDARLSTSLSWEAAAIQKASDALLAIAEPHLAGAPSP